MKSSMHFWWRWLVVLAGGVILFGCCMVVAPHLTQQVFGLLLFSNSEAIPALGGPAVAYIALVHGVLGAVMIGWGTAMLFIVLGPFRRAAYHAWLTLAVSLTAWFVPDTIISLLTGFWQNAVLNCILMALFTVPLSATYKTCRQEKT